VNKEIHTYLKLITRWWWLLIISAIIPMVISYHFASQQPDLYQAKATLVVGTSIFQDPDPNRSEMDLSNTLAAAYAELVRQRPVTEAVIERLGLERAPEALAGQIGTSIRSGAQLLEIQVIDTNPQAAALIANALADELIRRSPSSGQDAEQQDFIKNQLNELQVKVENINKQIEELSASLADLTSAAEIQDTQERIDALEQVKSRYQSTYADLFDSYHAESPNVLSLFEPASIPQSPIPSKTKLTVAVAGAAGVGLALGAVVLMEFLDTSLRWENNEDIQTILGLPVLGAIANMSTSRDGSLSKTIDPLSPGAEMIRSLRTNIFLTAKDQPLKTIVVTSPTTGDGKTFAVAQLGLTIAAEGKRTVIVVDADLRKPTLHEAFDRPNIYGVSDLLSGQASIPRSYWPEGVQKTDVNNVYLLPAGEPPLDPSSLLTSPRLKELLDSLKKRADVIIIDTPPELTAPDAGILASAADGTVLVVSAGSTGRNKALKTKENLIKRDEVNILGIAFNRVKARGYSYYYRNGAKRRPQEPGTWERLPLVGDVIASRSKNHNHSLGVKEMADRLGVKPATVRRWCKSDRLPASKSWLGWQIEEHKFHEAVQKITQDVQT
jgi:capsular exopolysaccharide synthesis family protein